MQLSISLLVIVFIIIAFSGLIFVACAFLGVHNLFIKQPKEKRGIILWEYIGPTPLGEKKYTPQGMTWVNGFIIFANTWKNERSRVYQINPENMKIMNFFDMPQGAVHTSGLAWGGKYLWGVDFISNRCYCIDLEPSLETGKVQVIGSFDTTLKGTSACCFVNFKNDRYLAISDFMKTRQTIFVRTSEAIKEGSAANAIVFSYTNEGFSQGLEFFDGYLYESENKIGLNIINKIDIETLSETKNSRSATVTQYPAPAKGVEDLAWDGKKYLWTSDESVFHFFRGDFLQNKTRDINHDY